MKIVGFDPEESSNEDAIIGHHYFEHDHRLAVVVTPARLQTNLI